MDVITLLLGNGFVSQNDNFHEGNMSLTIHDHAHYAISICDGYIYNPLTCMCPAFDNYCPNIFMYI